MADLLDRACAALTLSRGCGRAFGSPTDQHIAALHHQRHAAADRQGELGVDVTEMLGMSIHQFHKDPARVEKILTSLHTLPHHTMFSFGGITLETRINRALGSAGETLGYFKFYTLPTGISVSAFALVSSLVVFFVVSWLTRTTARASIDPDIRLVMDA